MKPGRAVSQKSADVIRLLAMTPVERAATGKPVSMDEIAEYCGVHPKTVYKYRKELGALADKNRGRHMGAEGRIQADKAKKPVQQEDSADIENYDSGEFLGKRSARIDNALMRSCESGNAMSLKIYYQLTKRLIEKQEVTHKLDGSFLARALVRADRELGDTGHGVAEVQEEPILLRQGVREPTGQGEGKDSEVRDMASPLTGDEVARGEEGAALSEVTADRT